MTDWLIIRTDIQKELFVARAIERMGFPSWCPVELRHYRTVKTRAQSPANRFRMAKEVPVMPKCLLAQIPAHDEIQGLQRIRHFQSVQRDIEGYPIRIPDLQIVRFRAYIDEMNEKERRRVENLMKNAGKKKAQKFKLDPSNLKDVLDLMFGQKAEVAA